MLQRRRGRAEAIHYYIHTLSRSDVVRGRAPCVFTQPPTHTPTDPHRTCGNAVPKIAYTYPARHIIIYTRTYLYMYTCSRVRRTYIYYTGYMGRIYIVFIYISAVIRVPTIVPIICHPRVFFRFVLRSVCANGCVSCAVPLQFDCDVYRSWFYTSSLRLWDCVFREHDYSIRIMRILWTLCG